MQLDTVTRNAILSAIATRMGSGGTAKAYTGSSPGVGSSATGTLLSTLTGVTFATPTGGTVNVSATADPSNAASGTPGYVRWATSGGTAVADFPAGTSGAEWVFSPALALGGTDTLTSCVLTAGNA